MTLIEQMAIEAKKKLAAQVNRSAGQHQRAIKRAFNKLRQPVKSA